MLLICKLRNFQSANAVKLDQGDIEKRPQKVSKEKMNIFSHWKQKLFSLVLAVAIWIILKESIEPGSLDQLLTTLKFLK
ncbi:hypothetical protein KZZ20_05815 [Methylacidiphilum fumariolicum]|uniref:Uncharacterized protein n=2 Tax=Candidatus Methylacidiphilum fumarolicum TaxID=591154 RepID=I0JYU6_METFB|nr:hypothetical protein [Candidatus Methylacidiphilum fumarolicum]MBW6415029.1 hypothetical protein [Candidatus Methylacidiphilum fumarolicum]CAI9084894.1 conserved protein of unknown function [Candidatus Methylacidiphilum fumarolicum]CCG92415.1 hypothetical protein MFUM_690062 [Methylacidiphilum fumariolicum SolV]